MPFPAISAPASVAIGLSIGAIGFVVQESLLRRRAARRAEATPDSAAEDADASTAASADVTATPSKTPTARRKATPPRRAKAGGAAPAAPVQQVAQDAPAVPTPAPPASATPAPATSAPASPAPATRVRPAPRRKAAAGGAPRASRRAAPADPVAALRKRQAALNRGLEAIVEFADGPARRAGATACADALLLAVPKGERGPQVSRFLHAAGAKESPARLQEMAEDAGVELAIALKGLATEIRTRSAE